MHYLKSKKMKTKYSAKIVLLLTLMFQISIVLAQTSFSSQKILAGQTNGVRSVFAADIDGDGDQDILSASSDDNKIAWYENTDSNGTFGTQQTISTEALEARSVFAADLDGDGDQDVLSASAFNNRIAWYENINGNGTFSTQNIISNEAYSARSVFAADLDGDGDQDVLSASVSYGGKVVWYENVDGNGTFGLEQIISNIGAEYVIAIDIDGDGDQDVLNGSCWFENTDSNGTFGSENVFYTGSGSVNSVIATDIDGDGDYDVLSASQYDDRVVWFENNDGNGTFGTEQIISTTIHNPRSVFAVDIDGDGDQDVLTASRWFENTDGSGTFGTEQIVSSLRLGTKSVYSADFDGDGDQDVLSASSFMYDDKIVWCENIDGNGLFNTKQIISIPIDNASCVIATDIDNDGDMDVLSSSYSSNSFNYNNITLYRNIDGNGTFIIQPITISSSSSPSRITAVDFDGDGDQDILSQFPSTKILWHENIDGNGTFGSLDHVIAEEVGGSIYSVFATDIDNDGDYDVISGLTEDDSKRVVWYENTDGNGTFGIQKMISMGVSRPYSVFAADIDGDNDQDVIFPSLFGDNLAWAENDGNGTFGIQHIISNSANYILSVFVADIDNDGDQDLFSASFGDDDKIVWYENNVENATFETEQIISTSVEYPGNIFVADVDGDSYLDILSASAGDDKIAWYRNTDGNGTFGTQQIISTETESPRFVFAADLDNDGDLDILSASSDDNKIAWYENLGNTTNVNEQEKNTFKVYPNPTTGIINMYLPERQSNIAIYDITGKLLITENMTGKENKLNISLISKGIYIIQVQTNKGVFTKKIIKE